MPNFNEMRLLNGFLLVFSVLVTLFLLIGSVTDVNRTRTFMKHFIILLISNLFMQLGEAGIWFFGGVPENVTVLKVSALMSFVFSYVLIASYTYCLLYFVREKKTASLLPGHIIAGICSFFIILSIVSFFNGIFFSYDACGNFVYGPLYGLVRVFDLIGIIWEILFVLRYKKIMTPRATLFLITFTVLPLAAMSLQFLWDPTPEYLATTLSLVVIYILFHGEIANRLIENEKQLAKAEKQLYESRISVMLSQIQPHFLYNSLNAIRGLCRKDPEQAREAIGSFAEYLRGNMDSLNKREPIPFIRELSHIENYLKLEKFRFGDELKVNYDIKEKNFFIPALSVQPLVENAVKHGICEKENGGTLTLKTYRDGEYIVIEVSDDGIGFDAEKLISEDKERSHIGIQNTRERLKQMIGASLTIESLPGKGTVAKIRFIPEENTEDN